MPKEYYGKEFSMREDVREMQRRSSITVRRWTPEEIAWVREKLDDGYTPRSVGKAINRTETAISIKMKRHGKNTNTYNESHREKKYALNDRVLDVIHPQTALDLYAGASSFYRGKVPKVVSNDIDEKFADEHDYQMDAFQLLVQLYAENRNVSFDLVDLDPFGSAFDCFDFAIRIAERCLIITFGELGHKRWRRLDFVRSAYGIEDEADFTIENLIYRVQHIGKLHKKKLIPIEVESYHNIGRVAFKIEPFTQTEQWVVKRVDKFSNQPSLDEWFDD